MAATTILMAMRTVSTDRTTARRAGFTLAEVLVAIALIAAVGAILIPSVARHLSRASAERVASDLQTISDGVHYFYIGVERLPDNLGQLETPPATDGTAPALFPGTTIPGDLARKWRGPYLHRRNLAAPVPTGYGATISSALGTGTLNGVVYLTLSVTGLEPTEFDTVDRILDGGDGAGAGTFRYDTNTSLATYFSTPVR